MEVTEKERQEILERYFNEDRSRLKEIPSKLKRKLVILEELIKQFEAGKSYSEQEVNQVLQTFNEDYALIRRLLVEQKYMNRTKDGKCYWVETE